MNRTVVSAPGKVLLAGGYLVLDRLYTGLVVATSSRFYCSVQHVDGPPPSDSDADAACISVRAGQFPKSVSTWIYNVAIDNAAAPGGIVLTQTNAEAGSGRNKFIEITLGKVLVFALERLVEQGMTISEASMEILSRIRGQKDQLSRGGLNVVVLADNDFYSQREQLMAASLSPLLYSLDSLTPFCPLPRGIGETNKTGLGSSAALVTSLVAGLTAHLGVVSLPSAAKGDNESDIELVHALAQVAHCAAQGKVGSGFDVASAVYGTHVYRRFSPSIIESLLEQSTTTSLLPALDKKVWDQGATPFRLPHGLRLMLADVDAGTDTPSFVGKVLAWRKREPESSLDLWTRLDEANRSLEARLTDLVSHEGDDRYHTTLASAAVAPINTLDASSSPIIGLLQSISQSILAIRCLMREMSAASDVPIEPLEQTRLLDECSLCPGVIGGGVPGAGGYDAIFLLVIDTPGVIPVVEDVWSRWTEMSVCPLTSRQSDGGLQVVEDVETVRGLAQALKRAGQ